MAKSILQDAAGKIVDTISEIAIKHKLDAITMTYEEVMSYRSKELQDSLLTFKTFINSNNSDIKSAADATNVDIAELKQYLITLGENYTSNLAIIYKRLGVDKKEYKRYNEIINYKIDQLPYDITLSKIIGPTFVKYTIEPISGFKKVRDDSANGTALYAQKYLYFRDPKSESMANMSTTHRSFPTYYGLYYGLNGIMTFDTSSRTLYLGESSDTNASTDALIKGAVQDTSIQNIVLPDGKTQLRGDVQIDKTLTVNKEVEFKSTTKLDDDVTFNSASIYMNKASVSNSYTFSVDSETGTMYLDKQATIAGVGLANTDGALNITKGSLYLNFGDIGMTKGSMTLSDGSINLTKGSITLTKGDLILSEGNQHLNGNLYVDNDNVLFIKKQGASDGTDASSRLDNSKLWIAQNGETPSIKFGSVFSLSGSTLTTTVPIINTSTSDSIFSGKIISTGLVVAANSVNLLTVDSSGLSTAKSITAGGSINSNSGESVINKLTVSTGLTVNAPTYIGSTLGLSGKLSSTANCEFTDNSTVGGCAFSGGVMTGIATSARYADLAEYYTTDKNYGPGTVLQYSGNLLCEAVEFKPGGVVLGVVTENPAFIMNDQLKDSTDTFANAVVLKGRSPVKLSSKCDQSYIIPGNVVIACEQEIGKAVVISNIEFNSRRQQYETKYIGRVINHIINVQDYSIEVKF